MTLQLRVSHVAVHLWQSTLFALVITVAVATVLRGREARGRHAASLIASLKFLVRFGVLRSLGASMGPVHPASAPMPEPIRVVLDRASAIPAALVPQGDIEGPVGVSWTGLLLATWAAGAAIVLFRWAREWH